MFFYIIIGILVIIIIIMGIAKHNDTKLYTHKIQELTEFQRKYESSISEWDINKKYLKSNIMKLGKQVDVSTHVTDESRINDDIKDLSYIVLSIGISQRKKETDDKKINQNITVIEKTLNINNDQTDYINRLIAINETIKKKMQETKNTVKEVNLDLTDTTSKLNNITTENTRIIKKITDFISYEERQLGIKTDVLSIYDDSSTGIGKKLDILKRNIHDFIKSSSEKELLMNSKIKELEHELAPRLELLEVAGSNLTAIPYMAAIMADYETYGIEHLATCLDWGMNKERLNKVKSIREIREDARKIVERNKDSQYKLAYLLELYPGLQDVIDYDYQQLPSVQIETLTERDPVHNYLSKEEYNSLSTTERNQLALDRYISSYNKTKWQIGRDYELFVGYLNLQKGYQVEYFGSNMGLEDLGRDLIVKTNDGKIYIIQCKYWSKDKLIHEKHITQLYGTTVSYCIENNLEKDSVVGVIITNTSLSEMAKKMAGYLKIQYKEHLEMGDFPRIKCNNGKNEDGEKTKIYHLPFDQQYDKIKMKHDEDYWAFTVAEAEKAGYRRANRWFGS